MKSALQQLALGMSLTLASDISAQEQVSPTIVRTQESFSREFAARLQSCTSAQTTNARTFRETITVAEALEKGMIAHEMVTELTAILESAPEGTMITDRSGETISAKKIEYTHSPTVTAWAFTERPDHMLFSGLAAQRQMPPNIDRWEQQFIDISSQLQEEYMSAIGHWQAINAHFAYLPAEKEQARTDAEQDLVRMLEILPATYQIQIGETIWSKTVTGDWRSVGMDQRFDNKMIALLCMQTDTEIELLR